MRIADIAVKPRGDELGSDVVWRLVSKQENSFWPFLWLAKSSYEKGIEAYYPVEAKMTLAGWGRFNLQIEYLQPAFRFFWNDKFWYVAQNGKVWLATLDANKWLNMDLVKDRAVITWGDVRATPIDLENATGDIFVTSLPLSRIKGWYDNIDLLGWGGNVKYIQAGKREGISVVRLIFRDAKDGNGGNILFADDPALWQEPGQAIKKIYPDPAALPPEIFIDTTYKGKILVRNRVQ